MPVMSRTEWPRISSRRGYDADLEREISAILGQMTLEEKIGQMIQAEVQQLTPDDVRIHKIGSALNGAGIWPKRNRYSTALEWVQMIEPYWLASQEGFRGRPFSIPFAWATDAVHGHNNLFGATIFPHNIGLGATHDESLIRRIGRVTAREIAASGIDWTFAPTVTIPCDARWGRFYEGYSEDPELVMRFAPQMVFGLEGDEQDARDAHSVIATIKHWLGDGGTKWGIDRGVNAFPEEELRDVHAAGFFSTLNAGAQVVMLSFSSWESDRNYDFDPGSRAAYNGKLHGSRYLITDVLKEQMQFDGIVITDWDGHCEVSKCTLQDARYCFNAGADVLMVEARQDWLAVIHSTLEDVRTGRISMSRIDDAVRRILRVKHRARLSLKEQPTRRELVRKSQHIIGCEEHRSVAREAVRKSLVLLKNRGQLLPLSPEARVVLAGSGAHDITRHNGGWSLDWQGRNVSLRDFPGAMTLAMAVRQIVGDERVTEWEEVKSSGGPAHADAAIVVIGEESYAEMHGDIQPWRTLEYASLKPAYREDLETIRAIKASGIPMVIIFLGGRPLYISEEIKLADAFVVAWLPGPEGGGITDVLFAREDGSIRFDFQGKLPVSWPATRRSFSIAHPGVSDGLAGGEAVLARREEHQALFPCGYGLNYTSASHISDELDHIALDPEMAEQHPEPPSENFELLGPNVTTAFDLKIAGNGCWVGVDVSRTEPLDMMLGRVEPIDYLGHKDALSLAFNGFQGRIASLYIQLPQLETRHLCNFVAAGGVLAFSVRMAAKPAGTVLLACHNCFPSQGALDVTHLFSGAPLNRWVELRVPLAELAETGSEFCHINVPFMLYTAAELRCDIGNIRWELQPKAVVPGKATY